MFRIVLELIGGRGRGAILATPFAIANGFSGNLKRHFGIAHFRDHFLQRRLRYILRTS